MDKQRQWWEATVCDAVGCDTLAAHVIKEKKGMVLEEWRLCTPCLIKACRSVVVVDRPGRVISRYTFYVDDGFPELAFALD